LTPKSINFDVVYLKPGSSGLTILSLTDFFTNSQSTCTSNECTYTFKDSSGNNMVIPKYIGPNSLDPNTIPSNLSGDWVGYVSCRTDS
jgi:hypothetical protein